MALSDERRRRLEEEQRRAVQNNLRAAAERDAATFDRLERQRARSQQLDYLRRTQDALAAAHERAARTRQEDIAEMQRVADVTAEQEAYDRNLIAWNNYWRPQREQATANLREAERQRSAAQRQRDRLRSGSSYWGRQNQEQEDRMYGTGWMSGEMHRPSDFLNPSQEALDAAEEYKRTTRRYQDTMARLDAKNEEANRAVDEAEKQQSIIDYERRYGMPIASGTGWEPSGINMGFGQTGRAKDIAKAVYDSTQGIVTADRNEYNYNADLMTDVEKNTVLNMAKAGKWDEIVDYANALQATIDARSFDIQQRNIANMSKVGQAAYGMMGTLSRPLAYGQIALDAARGRYTDMNAGAVGATRLATEARARSLENAGQVGQFVGNALYSTLDNAALLPLGQVGALVWMSAGAAGQSAIEALERGGTQGQALAFGTASGVVEYLTEKLPLENLFNILEGQGIRGLKDYLKAVAKQTGSEGVEEVISEFAGTLADRAIMGQKSEYITRIKELEETMSHDEAVTRANYEFFLKNPALAGAAGALSGAIMAGASGAINANRTARADLASGREITDTRRIADVVLDEGMKSTDKRIRDMAYSLDAIRRENNENYQWSAADQRRIGEIYDSLDDAAKKRISDDYAERERTRQEEEAERVRAREAEIKAEQDARAREDAQRQLAEREAETDRIVEDAEAIDLDNPEALTEEADTTARRGSDEYTDRVETAEDVDADMRRRAAAAEEATRTGDRSALNNLDQPRRTTESTAQTNRQTAQQEPFNPTQQRRDMKKQVRDVYSSMGITSEVSVGEIADAMQEAYNAIREKGDGSDSLDERKAFLSAAQEHFEEDMLRQAEEDRDRQFGTEDEVYTQARKTIRGTRLYVPQSLNASELGVDSFNEFRRANFGVLNLTRDSQAMPIDTFYDELVREYPGLFPDSGSEGGPTSEADMLRTIAEVYRSRGSTMQAEPIDTDAINAESKRKAMELYWPMVEAAQQAYTTAQTTARQNAEQAGQTTANNARRAGLSAADSLALSNVARDLGVGLEFRKMKYGRVNGFYNRETNTVVLNQDLSTAEMAWTTFAHEIVHAAESAGNYQQLADIAKRISVKDADKGTEDATWRGTVDELRRVYAQEGFKISRESAEHEAVTNILQDVLGSREALEGVVRESKANGRALLSDVDNVLDRTTTNNAAITPEAARLAEAQKALAAALNDAQENARYTASVPGQQVEASISGINMDEIINAAIQKYGRRKGGEQLRNAKTGEALTQEAALPNKAGEGTRTRQTLVTMAETKSLSNLQIRDLAMLDQYTPTSNEKNVEAAKKMRAKFTGEKALDNAFGAWKNMLMHGSWTSGLWANKIAFAEMLMNEANQMAVKTGDASYAKMALEIAGDIAYIGTEAGQTVQALSLIKRMSPEGQLQAVERMAQDYQQRHGGERKAPKDVQTIMDTAKINTELLDKLEQLEKLKKLEKTGGKQAEKVAERIAELEKEIDALNKKLEPLRKKLDSLRAERDADTKERDALKQEEESLPKQIENAQKQIDEIMATIDELNKKLGPKRQELISKLAQEGLKKAERNQLAQQLSDVENDIRNAKRRIKRAQAYIMKAMEQMSVKTIKLNELNDYIRVLRSSQEIMDTYLQYTRNKGGEVTIPEDLQKAFIEAKTDAERDAVRAHINQAIADQLPGTRAEKLRAWRYMSMLANPTTHLRNIAGNTMQYAEKGFRDTLAAGIEALAMKKNAALYQAASERAAKLEAELNDLNANDILSDAEKAPHYKRINAELKDAREEMRKNERSKAVASRFSKADKAYYDAAKADYAIIEKDLQAGGRASETEDIEKLRQIFGFKTADDVRKWAMNLLEKEDKFFLQANYTQSFSEYLKANGIDPANMSESQLQRARARSFREALEATYRDASALADLISKAEHQNAALEFAVGGIMPFKKTPINILKRGVEYSPLGLIRAVYDDVQAQRGKNTKTKTDLIAEYAEGLSGSVIYGLGILLSSLGLAAAHGDDDKDRKKALDKETGAQDYSIKIHNIFNGKDYTYTFDWLMPAAMAFFGGVSTMESIRDLHNGKVSAASVIEGMASIANPIFELSMLDGLVSMFKNYSADGADFATSLGWSILQSYVLQYFPTLGSKIARIIDPNQRSTYTPKDSAVTKPLERLYRRVMAKIPGLSYMLEPVRDRNGEIKANIGGNVLGRALYNLASPGYLSEITHEEADEETKRLYEAMLKEDPTNASSVLPPEVPTYYKFGNETYYLDAKEYGKVSEKLGKESAAGLKALYASEEYQKANNIMKAKMVSKVRTDAAEQAKRLFFEDIGILDDYLRSKLDGLVYDDSSGERKNKNLQEVRDIYEQNRMDLKTVEAAASELSHVTGIGAKIETLNAINDAQHLTQDEYDFLYMTKIAGANMQEDMQAVIDVGGDLNAAINTVARFYGWDDSYVDPKTGEVGRWIKYDKGTQAAFLSQSRLSAPAKEALYLNNIVSTNNVEKEQAKIDDYKSRGLGIDDYLTSLGVKYDDEGTAYENNAGFFRELYVSDLSAAVKEAAVYNLARYGGDGADKAQADIDAYKRSGLTVQDYILTKASLYDDEDKAYTKTSDKAKGLLNSGLSDKALKVAWYTVASDAQGAEDEINAFMKGGNTVKQYLQTKAATSGDGMKAYQKAQAVLKQSLSSYTAAITSIVTGSENQATGIQNCLNEGIRDRQVAEGYAKYAEINANDALNATQKATEFSKWLNTDKSMSNLTTAQRDMMRASLVYFMMTPASAGRYDSFMKLDGMRSISAESLASDLAALEPLPGAKSVSDAQRRHAVAYNSTASEKEIDSAMYLLLDSTDDGKEATGLANYKMARAAGLTAKQYVDYSEKLGTFSSDRDANGKEITGRKKQDKIVAYINGLPISRAQKNALWFLAGYKESTLKKQPWY